MRLEKNGRARARRGQDGRKRVVIGLYALWVTCVLLASAGYLAETATRRVAGDGEYEYRPHFSEDGEIKHYEVERFDTTRDAYIDITFYENTRTVNVESHNVRTLSVDCRSIAVDKHLEILGSDYADDEAYLAYFIDELGYLRVNADVDMNMTIIWYHMPEPVLVVEDGVEHEVEVDDGTVLVDIPEGRHSVDIYFRVTPEFPTAAFSVDHPVTVLDSVVTFDSSASDGDIDRRIWNFGDGSQEVTGNDAVVTHAFSSEGTYDVSLTVRTDEGLRSTAIHPVEVRKKLGTQLDMDQDGVPDWEDPDIDGDGVPNVEDDFPLDPSETIDTDGDGIGDNADPDDDGDGVPDEDDADPLDPDVGAAADDKEGEGDDMTLTLLIVAVVALTVVVAIILAAKRRGKDRRAAAKIPPPVPPTPAPPAGADLGFTPPPVKAGAAKTMEPVAEMEAVETMEVVEAEGDIGGPYDTTGMSKDEYLDSLDAVLRDEFSYADDEVELIMEILQEEMP